MKYIIALNLRSRYARPSVGEFHYSDKHQRHVWKGKEISDIAELSSEINAALNLVQVMDQIDLIVRVFAVNESDADVSLQDGKDSDGHQEPASESDEPALVATSRKRGRPRKLLQATP
jgi:hypothetical protein